MPANTTPDNITYPVTGDGMSPLNSWFAQLASSVQTALTALRGELATATTGAYVRIAKATASGADQTGISAETEVTGTSVTFTLTSLTTIHFWGTVNTYSTSATDLVVVRVRDNSTALADFTSSANSSPSASGTSHTHVFEGEVDLPAGSHRLNLSVLRAAGSGTMTVTKSAAAPPRMVVDKIA